MIIMFKLRKKIKIDHPEVRINMDIRQNLFEYRSVTLLDLFLSFGAMEKSYKYMNFFIDIKSIEYLKESLIKKTIYRLIRLTSSFVRLSIIMLISIVTAFIFFSNDFGS